MFRFPYGNLHGLNLDWLIDEWKKFQKSFTSAFTASMTELPVSSTPNVNVTYDMDAGTYNFDFGIPAEVKPQSFQIGYAESSSGTIIPTGVTWVQNPPAVAQGNYLWSRTMVIYNDGSYSATYACSRMGVDGAGSPATVLPLMDGTGAIGTSQNFAREDHVHPSDTTKANVTDITAINGEIGDINNDITAIQNKIATIGDIIVGTNYNGSVSVPTGSAPVSVSSLTLPEGNWLIIGCADVDPTDKYIQLAINSAGLNPARQSAVTTVGTGIGKETYLQTVEILATTGASTTLNLYCVHGSASSLTVYPYFYAVELGSNMHP